MTISSKVPLQVVSANGVVLSGLQPCQLTIVPSLWFLGRNLFHPPQSNATRLYVNLH